MIHIYSHFVACPGRGRGLLGAHFGRDGPRIYGAVPVGLLFLHQGVLLTPHPGFEFGLGLTQDAFGLFEVAFAVF